MDSIIQKGKETCYFCGMNRNLEPLECHHVFNGSNRKWSEKYGLTVYLHGTKCHRIGKKQCSQQRRGQGATSIRCTKKGNETLRLEC